LSHCAKSREVAGSIRDVVIDLPVRTQYGRGVDSSANKNVYMGFKSGRCVGKKTLSLCVLID